MQHGNGGACARHTCDENTCSSAPAPAQHAWSEKEKRNTQHNTRATCGRASTKPSEASRFARPFAARSLPPSLRLLLPWPFFSVLFLSFFSCRNGRNELCPSLRTQAAVRSRKQLALAGNPHQALTYLVKHCRASTQRASISRAVLSHTAALGLLSRLAYACPRRQHRAASTSTPGGGGGGGGGVANGGSDPTTPDFSDPPPLGAAAVAVDPDLAACRESENQG